MVNGQHTLASPKPNHDHEPAPRSADALKFREDLKRIAASDSASPAKLARKVAEEYPTSVQHQLSMNAQVKIVKRIRPSSYGTEPTTLDDFSVPADLQKTIEGLQFFQGVVEANGEKAFIFASDRDLQRLAQSRYWIADATFDVVPCLLKQLFSIHGSIGPEHKNTVPMVFVLMTSKTEQLYQQVLEHMSEVATKIDIEFNPSVILTDFERGMINAFQREFPDSRHSGCFFHLSQNMWKRVQQHGLVPHFNSSGGALYEQYKMIQALAFLPPTAIPKGFEMLTKKLPEILSPIITYLEEYYVLGRKKPGRRAVRTQPLYPPSLWSVHRNVLEGVPRTTNLVESWHSRFARIVGAHHVGIFRIIEELRLEQKSAVDRAEVLLAGGGPSKRMEYQVKDAKLHKIVSHFENYTIDDYVSAVAANL